MGQWYNEYEHYCRWDNKTYKSKKPYPAIGFCCNACKMAHYRAYKAYVTQKKRAGVNGYRKRVTQNAGKKTT